MSFTILMLSSINYSEIERKIVSFEESEGLRFIEGALKYDPEKKTLANLWHECMNGNCMECLKADEGRFPGSWNKN